MGRRPERGKNNKTLSACPACPVKFVYDSAVYPVASGNGTGAYFTGVAPEDGTGVLCAFAVYP